MKKVINVYLMSNPKAINKMTQEQKIAQLEATVRDRFPSWNKADVRGKAVRMLFLNEMLEEEPITYDEVKAIMRANKELEASKPILLQTYVLVMESWGIIDKCKASSKDEASNIFRNQNDYMNWAYSDIMLENDYKNELAQAAMESQSPE
jgi:hypothetical protein